MSTYQHTPGPWVVMRRYPGETINGATVYSPISGVDVARLTRTADKSIDEKEADARLIAAAPDLLAALAGVLLVADRATDEFDAARAAIAKAMGAAA